MHSDKKRQMTNFIAFFTAVLQQLWNRTDLFLLLALPEVFATVCLSAFLGEVK